MSFYFVHNFLECFNCPSFFVYSLEVIIPKFHQKLFQSFTKMITKFCCYDNLLLFDTSAADKKVYACDISRGLSKWNWRILWHHIIAFPISSTVLYNLWYNTLSLCLAHLMPMICILKIWVALPKWMMSDQQCLLIACKDY